MKIVIIDNYDSFTYNLSHLLKELGAEVDVVRNDKFELKDLEQYDKIVLSPGPGIPSEAGLLLDVIRTYAGRKPILGVCLGHQAICETYGATVTYAKKLMHGKMSLVDVDLNCRLFRGLQSKIQVARYHSLAAADENFPECLEVTARTEDGEIMAVKHRNYEVYGVQFHPESILTPKGKIMLRNFLEI